MQSGANGNALSSPARYLPVLTRIPRKTCADRSADIGFGVVADHHQVATLLPREATAN